MAALDVKGLREEYQGLHELVNTSDGKTLFVGRWKPDAEAPASVLIFHGITGHSGPYGPMVADQLVDSGFDVIPGARHAVFPMGSWTPLVAWLKRRYS